MWKERTICTKILCYWFDGGRGRGSGRRRGFALIFGGWGHGKTSDNNLPYTRAWPIVYTIHLLLHNIKVKIKDGANKKNFRINLNPHAPKIMATTTRKIMKSVTASLSSWKMWNTGAHWQNYTKQSDLTNLLTAVVLTIYYLQCLH